MTLPEMVFGETWLQIINEAQGLDFSFKAYEALDACAREVDVQVLQSTATRSLIPFRLGGCCTPQFTKSSNLIYAKFAWQVSVAETWQANKDNIPEAQKFDWTYSTKYRGTCTKGGAKWSPEPTDQKIDFESLKVRM